MTEGILQARPTPEPAATELCPDAESEPGLHPLGLAALRDGAYYIPPGFRPDAPTPLIMVLHGAGGDASRLVQTLTPLADEHRFILLAPESRQRTWDVILDDYGPDVAFIDRALALVFGRFHIDPTRIAIAGFSDGASYALSLGLINSDLFTHIVAFSPGFLLPTRRAGGPGIFISHGTDDPVLPVNRCSRSIVPRLKAGGYEVRYREFRGGHMIPPEIAVEALGWFGRNADNRAEPRMEGAGMDDRRDEKPSPALEQAAEKVRRVAEAEATRSDHEGPSETTAANDSDAAEAFHDLGQPELSKGRPRPSAPDQPSNAGNDGV